MKKIFILLPVIALLAGMVFSSNQTGPGATSGLERTGATGTTGCGGGTTCHGSATLSPVTVGLALGTTPVMSYVPGTSYNVVITCTYTAAAAFLPKCGYQLAVVKAASTTTDAGTWGTPPTGSHISAVSGIHIAEHSMPLSPFSGTGGPGTVYGIAIPWTAPAAGTGSIKIMGVLNAVDDDGFANPSDIFNNGSVVITEATSTGVGAITGTLGICQNSQVALTCTPSGGTWSSSTPAVGTVSATGMVMGLTPGTTTISYNAGTAGTASAVVTVSAAPAPVTGTATLCATGTTTLSSTTTGGTWSSGTPTVATVVPGSGVVSGVAAGTSVISYFNAAGCSSTKVVTVNAAGAAPITGVGTVCVGTIMHQFNLTPGGTWTSANVARATIGSSNGLVTGVSVGTVTISYEGTNSCGHSFATRIVTVNAVGTCVTGVAPVTNNTAAGLSIYPNPNNGSFTLNMQSDFNEDVHVIVCGISGEKVKEFTTTTNTTLDMNIPHVAGMYFVTATTAHGNYVSRLLIQ